MVDELEITTCEDIYALIDLLKDRVMVDANGVLYLIVKTN